MNWNSNDGDGGGPWGRPGPRRRRNWSGGNQPPPDLDDILRRSQDRFRSMMPGGLGLGGVLAGALIAIGIWLATGIYTVQEGEQGVPLIFGKLVTEAEGGAPRLALPGLHFNWPAPVGTVYRVPVVNVNTIDIGFTSRAGQATDVPDESTMLTGDQNIVAIDFTVNWRVRDPVEFLFRIRDPQGTVKRAAESVMRDVVGREKLSDILTSLKDEIPRRVREELQALLNQYGAGVDIREINLRNVELPTKNVIDAFRAVQAAAAMREQLINQATKYKNEVENRVEGESTRITKDADGYREQVIARAEGDASRFVSVHDAYAKSRDVTQRRLYLETLEEVLAKSHKIIIGGQTGGVENVLPLLPLPQFQTGTKTEKSEKSP